MQQLMSAHFQKLRARNIARHADSVKCLCSFLCRPKARNDNAEEIILNYHKVAHPTDIRCSQLAQPIVSQACPHQTTSVCTACAWPLLSRDAPIAHCLVTEDRLLRHLDRVSGINGHPHVFRQPECCRAPFLALRPCVAPLFCLNQRY